MSEIKMLPLTETLVRSGFKSSVETFARAVAEHNVNRERERAERLAEALRWYAEQAELCRKLGAAGDSGRRALDADGGKRARAALRDHDQETTND